MSRALSPRLLVEEDFQSRDMSTQQTHQLCAHNSSVTQQQWVELWEKRNVFRETHFFTSSLFSNFLIAFFSLSPYCQTENYNKLQFQSVFYR